MKKIKNLLNRLKYIVNYSELLIRCGKDTYRIQLIEVIFVSFPPFRATFTGCCFPVAIAVFLVDAVNEKIALVFQSRTTITTYHGTQGYTLFDCPLSTSQGALIQWWELAQPIVIWFAFRIWFNQLVIYTGNYNRI